MWFFLSFIDSNSAFIISCHGGGSSHSSSHSSSGGSGNCEGICPTIMISVFSVIGVGILICCIVRCYNKSWGGIPPQSNEKFVASENMEKNPTNAFNRFSFPSGFWTGKYYQYGVWHGRHIFTLTFDQQSLRVSGFGADDVGQFTITGSYSATTGRLGMYKNYQAGTGNISENLGHQVTIQLQWDVYRNLFTGKWYVQTSRFSGEDQFELEYEKTQGLAKAVSSGARDGTGHKI